MLRHKEKFSVPAQIIWHQDNGIETGIAYHDTVILTRSGEVIDIGDLAHYEVLTEWVDLNVPLWVTVEGEAVQTVAGADYESPDLAEPEPDYEALSLFDNYDIALNG